MKSLNARIKDHICDAIERGVWKSGDRIPSEAELAERFGASRMTVNRAVRELSDGGILNRRQGLGTFVASPVTKAPLFEIQSIDRDIERRGAVHSSRVLTLDTVPLSAERAATLGFADLCHAFYLEAVHAADDRPLQLERRHVNPNVAPDFINQSFADRTASSYLVANVDFSEVEHLVDAIGANPRIAALLSIPVGTPCLRLTRRTRLDAALVTHVELIHPGDAFRLSGHFAGRRALLSVA